MTGSKPLTFESERVLFFFNELIGLIIRPVLKVSLRITP